MKWTENAEAVAAERREQDAIMRHHDANQPPLRFEVCISYSPNNEPTLAVYDNVAEAEAAVAAWNAATDDDDVTYRGHAFIVGDVAL